MASRVKALPPQELKALALFKKQTEIAEEAQLMELFAECHIEYQFAKTHSAYVKDWEKTRKNILDRAATGEMHEDMSQALVEEMVKVGDEIIDKKLRRVREFFSARWGESIYNYIGEDGKTKDNQAAIIWIIIIGVAVWLLFFR